jgi:hypothetical protein
MYSISAVLLYEYLLWLIFTGAASFQGGQPVFQGWGGGQKICLPHSSRFRLIFKNTLFFVINIDLFWWEIQKEGDHWEDQDVDGWTILKWILER